MDTVDLKLAQDCESLAVAASEGVGWLKNAAEQSPTVAQQAPSLISELQKVRNQSRKLARAARRRMCVGVFGPSQAGKYYLVSTLPRHHGPPPHTRFAGVTSELRTDYWREAIDLAPRLSGRDRAKLRSVLWYDFQPFTDLYLTLYEGLEKLAFAPEALLSMDALIPREKSIIDVLTLDKLGADAGDTLLVRPKTADRRTLPDARLPRSLVCALTADLSVAIDEKPSDFVDH